MVLYLLRFGELWLKSEPVKKRFIQVLVRNAKAILKANGSEHFSFSTERGRIFLDIDKPVDTILSRIFGITSFSQVTQGNLENLEELVKVEGKKLSTKDTFAVRARRIGKHEFSSKDMEIKLGSLLVATYGNKVNLTNPSKTIYVEIRDHECYVFSDYVPGAGGLPVGTEGHVFAEYDGSQEAIVAAYLVMRRGCKLTLIGKGEYSVLQKYDPAISLVEEMPKKHDAKALVSYESFADAKDVERHGLFVLRPLVGMTKKEVTDFLKNI